MVQLFGRTAASINVYYGKSVAVVLILSREASKQLASSVVTGDNMCKLTFPVRATKTLALASKQSYSNFVCTCLGTQSMMKLNQKFTIRRHLIWGVTAFAKGMYFWN